jgi:hypothetical protein
MSLSRRPMRAVQDLLAFGALLVVTAALSGPASAAGAPAAAGGKMTFGTKPCGKLVSMEEVEAVFKTKVPMIDIEEENTCVYKDGNGFPVYDVRLTFGSKLECTTQPGMYLGKPVEKAPGIGDQAVWIPSVGTLCFVRGKTRVQLSFDSTLPEGSDQKALAIGLARKAVERLAGEKRH